MLETTKMLKRLTAVKAGKLRKQHGETVKIIQTQVEAVKSVKSVKSINNDKDDNIHNDNNHHEDTWKR